MTLYMPTAEAGRQLGASDPRSLALCPKGVDNLEFNRVLSDLFTLANVSET